MHTQETIAVVLQSAPKTITAVFQLGEPSRVETCVYSGLDRIVGEGSVGLFVVRKGMRTRFRGHVVTTIIMMVMMMMMMVVVMMIMKGE